MIVEMNSRYDNLTIGGVSNIMNLNSLFIQLIKYVI